MAGARLFFGRRAYPDVIGQLGGNRFQHGQTGGVVTIVIGKQDTHHRSSVRNQPVNAAHVRHQCCGEDDAAVFLLPILQNRNQSPPDRKA